MNNIEFIEEKEIIKSYEKGEWKKVPNFKTRKEELKKIFKYNFIKKVRN